MLNNDVWDAFISSTLLTFDSASHNNQISPFANDSPPVNYKEKKSEKDREGKGGGKVEHKKKKQKQRRK
jgi:hypothetical protein